MRVAVDDFGTGYASLAQLKEFLPLDILKIDQSFVRRLTASDTDTAIVSAVIDLADRLDLGTVAEGIEEPTQVVILQQLGCRLGQGFALGRPQPAAAFRALLADHRRARAA